MTHPSVGLRDRPVLLITALALLVAGCQTGGRAPESTSAREFKPVAEVAFLRGGDIWVAAEDGSRARQVTDLGACLELSVSADGTKAAAICGGDSDIPDETRLMVVNLLTGTAAQIETDGDPMGVDWSPNDGEIAYCAVHGAKYGARLEYMVAGVDGSEARRVYSQPNVDFVYGGRCRWTADGKALLLFSLWEGGDGEGRDLVACVDAATGDDVDSPAIDALCRALSRWPEGDPKNGVADLCPHPSRPDVWAAIVQRLENCRPVYAVVMASEATEPATILAERDYQHLAWTRTGDALLCTRRPPVDALSWRIDRIDAAICETTPRWSRP